MTLKYLKDVASITIDALKCQGCGMCLNVCPHQVIAMESRKAIIRDRDSCMECGACKINCPHGAVSVEAGVGCAYAILNGMLRGTAPDCGCGGNDQPTPCC